MRIQQTELQYHKEIGHNEPILKPTIEAKLLAIAYTTAGTTKSLGDWSQKP